MSMFPECFKLS